MTDILTATTSEATAVPAPTIGSFELAAKVEHWRQKVRDGTITDAELREALTVLRQGRAMVPKATGGSRTKAKAAAGKKEIDADQLLADFGGL